MDAESSAHDRRAGVGPAEGSVLAAIHADAALSSQAADAGDSMKGAWPDDTVRRLENWAMWLANDRRPVSTISPYPAYRLGARGKRAGNVIPILGVEAEKADRIITAMTPRYQQPLRLHYLWSLRSDRNKARACNCVVNTYKTRLDEAHAMFERAWFGRIAVASR